jgi:hypothetical protein
MIGRIAAIGVIITVMIGRITAIRVIITVMIYRIAAIGVSITIMIGWIQPARALRVRDSSGKTGTSVASEDL